MKYLLALFFLLSIEFTYCQEITQEDLSGIIETPLKAKANWEVYRFSPFQVSVKLPAKPLSKNNSASNVEQITYTVDTEKITDSNNMYFISVIKFNNGFSMDYNAMISQKEKLIAQYKETCKFTILSEKQINYNDRKGIQVVAAVIWPNNTKFIVRMEFTYHEKYCITQFVLGNLSSIINWSSELYFNSVKID